MVIDVYIIRENEHEDVSKLQSLFPNSMFNVMDVLIPRQIGLNKNSSMSDDEIYEAYQIQWCLTNTKLVRKKYDGVIILRSSSVTNVDSNFISRYINELKDLKTSFDIFYLCKWRDDCQKMTDVKSLDQLNVKIGRVYSPKGSQALFFSATGVSIYLGDITMKNNKYFIIDEPFDRKIEKELSEGNIVAYSAIGNIFNYDSSRASSNGDYEKTHECGGVASCMKRINNSGIYNYIWLIIILILIIIIMIIIFTTRKK